MEFISLNFVKHHLLKQFGKKNSLKSKINNYFGSFIDQHPDLKYTWIDGKVYVEGVFAWKMKKELEKLINKPIKEIRLRKFPQNFRTSIYDNNTIKKKIENNIKKRKKALEKKKEEIKQEFLNVIKNIKNNIPDHQIIGVFDLEFWEQDMYIILEIGWTIFDYQKNETKTTHLVIHENLKYKNGKYSKNNRFVRKDTQIVTLDIALQRFQEEFLDEVEILVGHGLENDIKVLSKHNIEIDIEYLDTAAIGAVFMNENNKVSLERLLNYLNLEYNDLHNAANDTEYIMKIFLKLGGLNEN